MLKNFKKKYIWIACAAVAMTSAGCSSKDEPSVSETPRSVLVYMVANNSLGASHYDEADLKEMEAAAKETGFGSSRLIVYHHARNASPVLMEITPEGRHVIRKYDTNTSSVASSRMNEVISDFKRMAPASKYGLILWSHGSGWIENGMEQPQSVKPLSFGDDGGNSMNVTTLAKTIDGKDFDYVYFDCCYMASVEVAYELRNVTSHIVASATELPAAGMPYNTTLPSLMKENADLVGAARATFNLYNNMTGENRTCTMSVINTEALDNLAQATRDIYAANNQASADFNPQRFMISTCYLYDFGQYAADLSTGNEELRKQFDKALTSAVIYKAATPDLWDMLAINHHSGLSTYLPEYSSTDRFNYDNLQWANDVASALRQQ